MNSQFYTHRIGFDGDLVPMLAEVCEVYSLGTYESSRVAPAGYQDLNIVIKTSSKTAFVKFFAAERTLEDCQRYIYLVNHVVDCEVRHPSLYVCDQGCLYRTMIGKTEIRLCVMKYVDGSSFYELGKSPNRTHLISLIGQLSRLHKIGIELPPIYDDWGTYEFLNEFTQSKHCLIPCNISLISAVAEEFSKIDLSQLDICLIHGDITSTNILLSNKGVIHIVDFSVCDYRPRIQELAVLLANLVFKEHEAHKYRSNYNLVIREYMKYFDLSRYELKVLPQFITASHAMQIIGATREKNITGVSSAENDYWFNTGKAGLKKALELWPNQ